ncbi:hypothetical protein J4405_03610 [Candidatus Woesearchaeota archaeon]|nr:hypothetical protein [Candidatus Woesearchaeota archaeon]
MFQELKLSSKEIKSVIISIILISIIFSYNDRNQVFAWNTWLQNLLLTFSITAIVILVYIIGIKFSSFKQGNLATFSSMDIKADYLRAFMALILMLISNGLLYFSSIYNIKQEKVKKLGQRYEKEKEFEMALSLFSGLFLVLILILIFNYLNIQLGILISIWFLAWNLVPIASSAGTDLFFFSRPLYFFSITFFPLTIILTLVLPSLLSLILSLVFSIIVFVYYFFKVESGIK